MGYKMGCTPSTSWITSTLPNRTASSKVVTNLAVMDVKDGAFHLLERAPGVSVEQIREATAGKLVIPDVVPEMSL